MGSADCVLKSGAEIGSNGVTCNRFSFQLFLRPGVKASSDLPSMRTLGLLAAAGARCSGFVLPHTRFAASLAMSYDSGPGDGNDMLQAF